MTKHKWLALASLPALLVGVAAVRAESEPSSGYFVDHQTAVDRGGVGNYAPQYEGEYSSVSKKTEKQASVDTGRFVDHDQAVAMGGVGNYVSRSEAKRYDAKIAEEERLRREVASAAKEEPPVAEASPDQGVIFFDFGKADLKPDGKAEIASVSKELKKDPNLSIEVNGYTDNVGGPEFNQKLSEQRADAVKRELLGHGVSPEQIQVYAFGEDEPIASNDSDSGRAVNRRTEIYVESATETG